MFHKLLQKNTSNNFLMQGLNEIKGQSFQEKKLAASESQLKEVITTIV
jgi:hypothetical protein